MVKRLAIVLIVDTLILAVIVMVIIPRGEITKECNSDLFWAGMSICLYQVFFILRTIVICTVSDYNQNPLNTSTLSRLGFVCIDCIAYTAIVVHATL